MRETVTLEDSQVLLEEKCLLLSYVPGLRPPLLSVHLFLSQLRLVCLQMAVVGGGGQGPQPVLYHFDHVPRLSRDHKWSEYHPGVRVTPNGYHVRALGRLVD